MNSPLPAADDAWLGGRRLKLRADAGDEQALICIKRLVEEGQIRNKS